MANSPTPCGIEDIPVQVPSVIKQLCIALFLFCDQFISFYINILFKTTLIFCSSNWRPIPIHTLILTSLPHSYWVTLICHCLRKTFCFFSCWFFSNCQSNFPLNLNYKRHTKSPGSYSWPSVHVDVDVVAEGTGWHKHVLARVCATDHCNGNHDENLQLLCDAVFCHYVVIFAP